MKRFIAFALAIVVGFSSTSCFGTFQLTRNVYSWHDSVTDNKFVKSLLYWGMTIIPVYPVVIGVDGILLNLIEFWGGSNPLSMEEGQSETEYHNYAGIDYEITASKNRFDFKPLNGEDPFALVFNKKDKSWLIEEGEEMREIVRTLETTRGVMVQVYDMDGNPHVFDLQMTYTAEEIEAEMSSKSVALK